MSSPLPEVSHREALPPTKIVAVETGSLLYVEVLRLWRAESDTLGFMPEGGFEDAAKAGTLLAAHAPDGSLQGYVMFRRTADGNAVIVHLCIGRNSRGAGLARALFDAVKMRCSDCYDIRLRCRRDYSASSLWPRLGMVPVGETPGRGRDGILTTWRYEVKLPPLLRHLLDAAPREGATRVAVDANVFFDLDEECPGREESLALLADWLSEFVELSVTEEIYTEINRRASAADRERQWRRARGFAQLVRDVVAEEKMFERVRLFLKDGEGASAVSDARQVAMAAAAGVAFFVTRDEGILGGADDIESALGIRILSPHELVIQFDRLRREEAYQPRRLFMGPTVLARLGCAGALDSMVELMHVGHPSPEPKRRTASRLRDMLAQPERFRSQLIEKDGVLLVAYVLERADPRVLGVPFFAVANTALGRTAAAHYVEVLVGMAAAEGRTLVKVSAFGERVVRVLAETGFVSADAGWLRLVMTGSGSAAELALEAERLGGMHVEAASLAGEVAESLREGALERGSSHRICADLERVLWPAKIVSVGTPSYVVPIQPRWAKELFDRELAERTLFGAVPGLMLSSENVYYRAARPLVLTAPGRLLWYVSGNSRYPGSKAVRACSYVEEVVVGPARDLFRRFRRLGVYEWRDLVALGGEGGQGSVMAVRFGRTELFRHPVGWSEFQGVLRRCEGRRSQVQAPISIGEECFLVLYSLGMGRRVA